MAEERTIREQLFEKTQVAPLLETAYRLMCDEFRSADVCSVEQRVTREKIEKVREIADTALAMVGELETAERKRTVGQ